MKEKQINQNWKEFELGEIGALTMGQSPKGDTYNDHGKGLPLLNGAADFKKGKIKPKQFSSNPLRKAEKGDLLFCIRATIGKTTVSDDNYCLGRGVAGLKPLVGKVSVRYLLKILDSKLIKMGTQGSTIKGLRKEDIQKIKIPLPVFKDGTPDLEKQKQIVAILEKAEGLKDKRRGLDELFDEYLKSVFYEMFGDPFKNKNNFVIKPLKKIADFINGRAFKPSEWSNEGLKIIRIQNLNNSQAKFNYFSGKVEEKNIVTTGDLLFSWSGTPGTSFGVFIWRGERAVLNQHIFNVRIREKVDKIYFQYFLNSKLISKSHGGVGLQHITKYEVDKVKFTLPPLSFQEKFASIVSQVEKIKDKLKVEKNDADELFNALIQKAFSGGLL